MDRIRSFVCVDAFDGLGQLQFSKGGVQTVLGSQDIPCGPLNNCTCEIFPVVYQQERDGWWYWQATGPCISELLVGHIVLFFFLFKKRWIISLPGMALLAV